MASTNQVNTVTTENVVPVGATYDANGNFITLVGAAGAPINTLSGGGTANGVAYLNGSKVLTTGSALTFDGTNLGIGTSSPAVKLDVVSGSGRFVLPSAVGRVFLRNSTTVATELHVRPDSGKSGFVTFTEDSVADRWIVGIKNGNGGLFFNTGSIASNTDRLVIDSSGNLQVPAMYATTVTTPRNVFIDSNGNMGGISSVRASKTNITAIDTANWIYQLNPVTFNYRKKDEEGAFLDEFEEEQQFGLIAEDVETVKPELCIYVDDKLQGVHYDRMIAPLIKAIQEQQAIIQSLTDRIAQLEAK
jgi:hypothetical protein